jgi:2-dehydropantoate 2-reductase
MSVSRAQRLTVAIVGLGSIGSAAAGTLAAAGRHDVIACVRRPLERLTLERPEGVVEVPLRALTEPAQAERVDWVLLCTKTHATASAAPWLARLCAPSTRVAVLQNGIDHVARVAPLANGAEVVPVIVYYNGERLAPDRVRLRQGANSDFVVADDDAGTPSRTCSPAHRYACSSATTSSRWRGASFWSMQSRARSPR